MHLFSSAGDEKAKTPKKKKKQEPVAPKILSPKDAR